MDRITLKNEPKLSEHGVQREYNERRKSLVAQVKDFIASYPRFKDEEVGVTFADKGVSSLVCIVETPDEKLILKLRLSAENSSEGLFLETWERAGIKVPHVIDVGTISGHDYTLMEYIDAPTLNDKYTQKELLEKEIYFEMGATLRAMHESQTEGYGRVVDGKAEFDEFKDWLLSKNKIKGFQYVTENTLLGEEHGPLSLACEILTEYVSDKKSSYCHCDFGPGNLFATNPITVFDPNPELHNGYMDLGRSVVIRIANDGVFPEQMVNGYFSGRLYEKNVLQAAILLNAYTKFTYWHKIKKVKHINNVQNYLIQTKHLLEK